MMAKASIANGATIIVFAVVLLGAAGRVDWPAAWAFLILFFAVSLRWSGWRGAIRRCSPSA